MFSSRTEWKLEPNRFTLAHREMLRAGREILDLTISNPTRVGIEYDPAAILDALRNPKSLDYDPQPKGLRSAREAVAEYYAGVSHRLKTATGGAATHDVDPESLILNTSTSEGYSYVFRLLCNPGDEVLVPKPSYPLFDFLADLQDVKLVGYPLIYDHGWQIDWQSLERAVGERTRAVVVVHPNNPTGSYVSAEERARLNELCATRGLALIVDEVFLDYAHSVSHPLKTAKEPALSQPKGGAVSEIESFATNHDVLTFTLSGLSKISALPQMKLAWIAVSGAEEEANAALKRLEVIADTYLSLSAPVQLAAAMLLEQKNKIQPQLIQRVRANLAELDRRLAGQQGCARLEVEGGWYAVLRVPATRSDEELAIELLKQTSVLVHPGHFYDFPRDGYLVLSLITREEHFREAIRRLLEFLNHD
jgi:aspartate/methionine/tyrosine aminotransferase